MEIRKEKIRKELTLSRIYKNEFQKEGTQTAELKQKVLTKSYYPSKSISNDKQDSLFTLNDFGFKENIYENVETRVAWIDVPEKATEEEVRTKLNLLPNAGLYRILSNHPILTENQVFAIESSDFTITKDQIANRQVVRYPESHEKAGQIALDNNGKPQYRAIFFSKEGKEDEDLRTSIPDNFYMSKEIQAELEGITHIVEGQEL